MRAGSYVRGVDLSSVHPRDASESKQLYQLLIDAQVTHIESSSGVIKAIHRLSLTRRGIGVLTTSDSGFAWIPLDHIASAGRVVS